MKGYLFLVLGVLVSCENKNSVPEFKISESETTSITVKGVPIGEVYRFGNGMHVTLKDENGDFVKVCLSADGKVLEEVFIGKNMGQEKEVALHIMKDGAIEKLSTKDEE